jgi:hypothetical protein
LTKRNRRSVPKRLDRVVRRACTFIHATRPSRGSLIYLLAPVLVDKSGHDPTFSPQILSRPFDLFHARARGVADVATCRAAVLFNTLVSVGASVGRSGGGRPTDPDFPHKTDRQRNKSWVRPRRDCGASTVRECGRIWVGFEKLENLTSVFPNLISSKRRVAITHMRS